MLHVDTYGAPDAPPLLAVHGITGFGARFRRLADAVPERRWLCPGLRGHGSSPARAPSSRPDHEEERTRNLVFDEQGEVWRMRFSPW